MGVSYRAYTTVHGGQGPVGQQRGRSWPSSDGERSWSHCWRRDRRDGVIHNCRSDKRRRGGGIASKRSGWPPLAQELTRRITRSLLEFMPLVCVILEPEAPTPKMYVDGDPY